MPLLSVNAIGANVSPAVPGTPLGEQLAASLASLPAGAPIVVMIHGFRFCPHLPKTNPHSHILALDPRTDCWKAISWPRHLGFGRSEDEGLCIGFV